MAAMVLAAAGLRTVNLGPDTPVAAFERALRARPALVWVSASAQVSAARRSSHAGSSLPPTITIVIGGRRGDEIHAKRARRIETMTELSALATSLAAG